MCVARVLVSPDDNRRLSKASGRLIGDPNDELLCLAFARPESRSLAKSRMHHVRMWYTLSLPNAVHMADALARRPIGHVDDIDRFRCSCTYF
jgi:hypothetical protein